MCSRARGGGTHLFASLPWPFCCQSHEGNLWRSRRVSSKCLCHGTAKPCRSSHQVPAEINRPGVAKAEEKDKVFKKIKH